MTLKEFEDVGKKPGLQVWRVENMEPNPVPAEFYGNFFEGDAYIILHTSPDFLYNVHIWIGSNASQDEAGAAAILMIQLDDVLGGKPIQCRECQNQESNNFLGYFKKHITYKKGGVASGFKHVASNHEVERRVLHLKGRRTIRATEVESSWDSFNKGDCFIIDLGKNIYHWAGSESNHFERLKTMVLATDIRDNERHGRATIEMIIEGEEPEEVINVLGPKPDLPLPEETDIEASQKHSRKASLYQISDAAGSMSTTLVADENPFKQDMLKQSECYILDSGSNRLFVWKGKDANSDERKAAFTAAQKFIKEKNYSKDTQITVFPDGAENTLFKQFFFNWLDKDESTGPSQAYTIGKIAQVEKIPFDASSLHNNKTMAAQHGMVDDGSGKVQIWRVEEGNKVQVDPSTYGQFFGGDCYIVLYSYANGTKHIIYFWQGLSCSKDELGASALLTVQLDDSMGGAAIQVRVTQGQEPAHFVSLFKDKTIIVHLGGTSRSGGQSKPAAKRLFHIRQSSSKATRAVEVEPGASSLNTNDVFVFKTEEVVMIWKGKGATEEEMEAAKYLVDFLGGSSTEIEEGKEPDDFWEALGGKEDYQTSESLRNTVRKPRLFWCSNKTGSLIAEEVPGDFTQMDLLPDDNMILDTWDLIYVWLGREANETEKTGAPNIAQDYVNSDPSGRRGTPISIIKQGDEPPTFTGWFLAWDPDMWDKDPKDLISMVQQQTT